MNKGAIGALAFVGGAIAGAGAAYVLLVKPEKERHEEEIKDIVEYYHGNTEKRLDDIKKRQEDLKAEGEMIRDAQDKLKKLATPYDTFSDEGMTAEEFRASLESPKEDPQVYDISADDFINGNITYEKVSLRLFEADGVVVDENDEPVIADDLIGIANLNRLVDGEEEGLYLRDDDKLIDYEIDRVEGAYSDLIGGV